MQEQPVNPLVLEEASALINRRQLRALDALQLGTAVVARQLLGDPEIRFIASDKALLDAASKEGFDVWDPASGK